MVGNELDRAKDFEGIKQSINGEEAWFARDLMPLLGYDRWENFTVVVTKAIVACKQSGDTTSYHFRKVTKMIETGKGAQRPTEDYLLSRYACYLIAQNGSPQKPEIARAQTYFAQQTRRQELNDRALNDVKRLGARKKLTVTEKKFAGIVMERGVDRYGLAEIKAKGDEKLFGGHTTQDMKTKYGVKGKKPLADVLPTVSLKAKDLAAEMTVVNTEQNNLRGKSPIVNEHLASNSEVRVALMKRGIRLEFLKPEEDIKKVERRLNAEKRKKLREQKAIQASN